MARGHVGVNEREQEKKKKKPWRKLAACSHAPANIFLQSTQDGQTDLVVDLYSLYTRPVNKTYIFRKLAMEENIVVENMSWVDLCNCRPDQFFKKIFCRKIGERNNNNYIHSDILRSSCKHAQLAGPELDSWLSE